MGWQQSKPAKAKMPDLGAKRFQKYKFPFENIVMEGGGAKGIAYIGAVKVLEDAGIMKNIKRVAGTSAGAITAGFLAVGMTAEEVLDIMNKTDMPSVLLDGRHWTIKHVGAVYDVLRNFGVFKGQSFLDWYGDTIREYFEKKSAESDVFKQLCGNINLTQLHEALGLEFCTVAYNTQSRRERYFHVKTSPLIQVREAVRMSMSIPVAFQPYKVEQKETAAHWIDGGVCANFPVYCFDGWWLSMDEGNSFHDRLGGDQDKEQVRRAFLPEYSHERFIPEGNDEEKNAKRKKTLGLLLYSEGDPEFYQDQFEARVRNFTAQSQYQEFKKELIRPKDSEKCRAFYDHAKTMEDMEKVSKENHKKNLALKTKLDEVKKFFPNKEDMRKCFGRIMKEDDVLRIIASNEAYEPGDHDKAFKQVFINVKGEVTMGITKNIFDNWAPLSMAEADYLKSTFIRTPAELYAQYLDFVGKTKPIREDDVDRCVAIDVDYIGTMDFDMAPEDKTFLMMQGAIATIAFLEEFIEKNGLTPEQ